MLSYYLLCLVPLAFYDMHTKKQVTVSEIMTITLVLLAKCVNNFVHATGDDILVQCL